MGNPKKPHQKYLKKKKMQIYVKIFNTNRPKIVKYKKPPTVTGGFIISRHLRE